MTEPIAPSQITCPNCQAVSSSDKKYCADCGAPLTDDNLNIRALVDEQVRKAIESKYKDQKLIELETSFAIADRLTNWVKIFAFWIGGSLIILAIALAFFGIQKFTDFSSKIDQVVQKISPILDQSIKEANDAEAKSSVAQKTAEAAQQKSSTALTSVDTIIQKTKILDSDVNTRIRNMVEESTNNIEHNTISALQQIDDIKQKLNTAAETIATQEKKITDTGELVKAIFAGSRTEAFEPTSTPDQMVVIKHDDAHASVYLLLKEVPIESTVQLQYKVFIEPRASYYVLHNGDTLVNVIGFRWGESATNLAHAPLTVSYIRDPTVQVATFKALTVKNDQAFADGVPLPDLFKP